MKTTIKLYLIASLALLGLNACVEDDDIEFTAAPATEGVVFTSAFSDEYLLSAETASNIAERFVWNTVDLGAPTPVSYQLQGSISETFDEPAEDLFDSGTLQATNHAVKISDLLTMADRLELDADETASVYFRVKAFAGDGQSNSTDTFSPVQALTIKKIVAAGGGSDIAIASWGIVGSGANDWGNAGPDLPFYTTSQTDVLVAYANLKDGEIKFRENNDWTNNFGDDGADGTLEAGGANIAVTAGDYKITLNLGDNTYTMEAFSLGIVGSAWNDWGNAGPDAKMFYDYTTDSFVVGVKLQEGEMKVRLNNDWTTNYGDTGNDGTAEAGGDNIAVTAGFYQIRLDVNNLTFTVEETDIWGIIGSGYNDWGNAGPDFSFSQYNTGKWIAQNVTLIDGEIKFRVNEDWTVNLGDEGADGTLEDGGANIAVTAGTYDIFLDLTDAGNRTYTLITK